MKGLNGSVRAVLTAASSLALCATLAACGGALGARTSPGGTETSKIGDTSPQKMVEGPTKEKKSGGPKPPTPEETEKGLDALEQPTARFTVPDLPKAPPESADELDHIVYKLEIASWNAAGLYDKKTSTKCTKDSDDLLDTGTHNFDCTVKFSGVQVKFAVTAKVTAKKVFLTYKTENLPLSVKKAVYETTRQSFRPAKVTCDFDGLKVVRVGKDGEFACEVTDVEEKTHKYSGEMLQDGALAIRMDDSN